MKRRWKVFWTWKQSDDVATKREGVERARAWKEEREAAGWTVRAAKGYWPGYVAYSPDAGSADYGRFGPDSKIQTFLVVEMSENDFWIKPPDKPTRPKPEKPKVVKRRGRKPVGA